MNKRIAIISFIHYSDLYADGPYMLVGRAMSEVNVLP
jgi:hypothetical protein